MSKKLDALVALAGVCALSLFLLSCGSSSSRPSGLLYVLTQGSSGVGNNVSSFAIDLSSGNLSLINSNASTCTTSGVSCGLPLNILLDPAGAAAFVLNQGVPSVSVAPTIYPYAVNSDGSLSSPGTPVAWNCISQVATTPPCTAANSYPDLGAAMARDAAGQFLFVIDQGSSPPPTTCPARGAGVMNATDAMNFAGCPSISVFATQPGSTALTFVSQSSAYQQSPFFTSKIPSALSVLTFTSSGSTTAQEFLFVTNNSDICTVGCNPLHNDNTLSVYSVSSSGVLTEQVNSPYSTATIDPLTVQAVNTNPGQASSGVFVYVGAAGNAAGALDLFQMCTVIGQANCSAQDVNNEVLVPVGSPTSVGQKPVGMVVDPTNKFLYVVNELSSNVYGFLINTTAGTLTALSPANLSTGSQPVALAMHSSGKFLYTSNNNASSISAFAVSTTSGSMSSLNTVNSPSGPRGMAAR